MSKEPTYNDFKSGTRDELKQQYGLNGMQLEQALRKHHPGANSQDLQKVYKEFYDKK